MDSARGVGFGKGGVLEIQGPRDVRGEFGQGWGLRAGRLENLTAERVEPTPDGAEENEQDGDGRNGPAGRRGFRRGDQAG